MLNISTPILALNVSGDPLRWCSYEDAAYYYAKDLVAWSIGDDYTLNGGIQRATGKRSAMKIESIIAIRGKINTKRSRIPRLTNSALFRRDLNLCAYCGQVYTNAKLTRDHVIPRTQNGVNRWGNVVTACSPCNKHKGGLTPEQAHMELIYVPYVPCLNEYLILMNKHILIDQMDYLIKNVKNQDSRIHEIIKTIR